MSFGNLGNRHAASTTSISSARAAIAHLSDPDTNLVDAFAFDALCIEMLDIVVQAATVAQARQKKRERLVEEYYQLTHQSVTTLLARKDFADQDEASNSKVEEGFVRSRLEGMGYRIGWCLAERLSRDRPPLPRPALPASAPSNTLAPPPEPLEIVKFICKDIWTTLYDKQIDNLRTNHRGVFVLQDNSHKPLMRLSGIADDPASREAWVLRAQRILYMPCGILRGAIACFGITGVVTAELGGGTQCTFQFKQAKS